ncbi:MAG: GNAT family N-acetyltransferase [Chloroflexi bacterium]|nr:GNAT family N-acetyltransferase [Chloroflexota bacterium]
MIPPVNLRPATRDDVSRVHRWLHDRAVYDSWFGLDPLGRPVHIGYSPPEVLQQCADDWQAFLNVNHHKVLSVHALEEGHIGEAQLHFVDGETRSAEVFVLIGRPSLWRRGYGTAATVKLLDYCFYTYGLEEIFAAVPEANASAIALFQRIGFTIEGTQSASRYRKQPCLLLALREPAFQQRRSWLVEPVSRLGEAAVGQVLARPACMQMDILRGLSREQRAAVVALSSPMKVPAGWEMGKAQHPGDCLYFILEGLAELTASSSLGEVTVRIAHEGEALPLASLLGQGRLITSITAMTEMEVLAVPRSRFKDLCAKRPDIGNLVNANMAETLAGRYKAALAHFASMTQRVATADLWANI